MEKTLWVLMNPDNEHWDEEFAREELERLAKKWEVEIIETIGETQDTGFGQEVLFILEGEEENILAFEEELDEVLY